MLVSGLQGLFTWVGGMLAPEQIRVCAIGIRRGSNREGTRYSLLSTAAMPRAQICSRNARSLGLGLLLGGALVLCTLHGQAALKLLSRGSGWGFEGLDAAERVTPSSCGSDAEERDLEYWTEAPLMQLPGLRSSIACCAACTGHPDCRVWTWWEKNSERPDGACVLNRLPSGATPAKVPSLGAVSGFAPRKIVKHGIVAGLLGKEAAHHGELDGVPSNGTCRGEIDVSGIGRFHVVNAEWQTPAIRAQEVDVQSDHHSVVMPRLKSRAYLAMSCTAGEYHNEDYANLHLLGKTLSYTVDLNQVGCGCNAQLHLIPMRQNKRPGRCKDFFCGPSQGHFCGETCAIIRVQDGNQYSWLTGLHAGSDPHGTSRGYGGSQRRDWNESQYGPGADCIDTSWPFDVALFFDTNDSGNLDSVTLTLYQPQRACNLTTRIGKYEYDSHDGLEELSSVLKAGVTISISYWNSHLLSWMDGIGSDGGGPCVQDVPYACPRSMRFYNFAVRPQPPGASSVSPLGTALATMHTELEKKAEKAKREELEIKQSMEPCTDCEMEVSEAALTNRTDNLTNTSQHQSTTKAGHGASTIGATTKDTSVRVEGSQWEVVASSVPVHASPSHHAKRVGRKAEGEILVGEEVAGDWLHLLGEHGWVAIGGPNGSSVKRRLVVYNEVKDHDSCENSGLMPIRSVQICRAASSALGYIAAVVSNSLANHGPHGCYLMNGKPFLKTSYKDVKRRQVEQTLLCVSRESHYTARY